MKKPAYSHRRQKENATHRPRKSSRGRGVVGEEFVREETIVRYRRKDGRFTKKRKGAKKFVYRRLIVRDVETGQEREYGRVRENMKKALVSMEETGKNIFLKDLLTENDVTRRLQEAGARGVEISIRGKSRKQKDIRIKFRAILDKKRLADPKYVEKLLVGKILEKVSDRGLRLSSVDIGGNKRKFLLSNLTFRVSYFY